MTTTHASAAHEALLAFTSASRSDASSSGFSAAGSDAQRLQRALLTWQHPNAPLPPAAVSAICGCGKQGQGLLDARRAAWQEAFRSLFLALRSGLCAAFYLATPQVLGPGGHLPPATSRSACMQACRCAQKGPI